MCFDLQDAMVFVVVLVYILTNGFCPVSSTAVDTVSRLCLALWAIAEDFRHLVDVLCLPDVEDDDWQIVITA